MTYELPSRGDLNWDTALNNSIEAVKATADNALSTATDAETRFAALQTAPAIGDFASQQISELLKRQTASVVAWAGDNNVNLLIGEMGTPAPTTPAPEARRWRAIGYDILGDLYSHNIPVFCWSARKAPRPTDVLDPYKASGGFTGTLDTSLDSAEVFENAPNVLRGINSSDGHLGYNTTGATGGFNDVSRGTFNTDYTYAGLADYAFLYAKGYRAIRLTVRWERIQPTLNAALDSTEMGRIDDSIAAAGAAGLQVYLCLKNHGAYYQNVSGTSTRRILGSAELTQAMFVDLWTRLSTRYKNNATVVGYDLDNEPANPSVAVWQAASQAALTAIRDNSDTKIILVEGGGPNFSALASWVQDNGATGWITDPANNFYYSPHFYPQGFYQLSTDYVSIDTTVSQSNGVADRLKVYNRALSTQQLDALVQSMPIPSGTTGALVSGTAYYVYFDCHLDLLVSKIEGYNAVAGSGLTVARMALGQVTNYNGDFTILAESANDPTPWQSANQTITESFSTSRGGASSVKLVKGQRYVAALIIVGSGVPTVSGQLFTLTGMGGQLPKLAKRLTTQTDLPAPGTSVLASSLADVNGRYYMTLKP